MTHAVALEQQVLVLNRGYSAVRVVPARDAFTLLCREAAEIISVENGQWANYNLTNWIDVATLQKELEPLLHSWIRLPKPFEFQSKSPTVYAQGPKKIVVIGHGHRLR